MKNKPTTAQRIAEADNSPDLMMEAFSSLVFVIIIILIYSLLKK